VGNTYIPEAYPGTDPIWKMRGDRRTNKTPDLIAISDVPRPRPHARTHIDASLCSYLHNCLWDEFAAANSDCSQDRLFEEVRKWYKKSESPLVGPCLSYIPSPNQGHRVHPEDHSTRLACRRHGRSFELHLLQSMYDIRSFIIIIIVRNFMKLLVVN
jgi:hypothetical protein